MDHAEARELLELAAVEPGGLERLMAGDTPESAAVAGHLAGCPTCQDDLRRLHAAAALIRGAVRATPRAELRERTLAYVVALGRPRGVEAVTPAAAADAVADVAPSDPGAVPAPEPLTLRRRHGAARWLAGAAAAVVLAIATAFVVGAQRDATIAERDAELARRADVVAALERITAASLRVASEPDATNVALDGTGAAGAESARGTLAFSPSSRELVVIATGLPRPGAGREFRCWVEDEGERRPVGRMYFARDLAFWVGEVDAVGDLTDGSTFGVTLVDRDGDALEGAPALLGEL